MVASLLLLDARATPTDEARDRLIEAHVRVMAVAALERQLSLSRGDAAPLRPYFDGLCASISEAMLGPASRVSVVVAADDVTVDADSSAYLGMIVTELVTNAIKHAFPDGRAGRIEVSYVAHPGGWALTVRDDGNGAAEADGRAASGQGAGIVQALARQLRAEVTALASPEGTSHAVVFTAPRHLRRTRAPRGRGSHAGGEPQHGARGRPLRDRAGDPTSAPGS